MSGRPARMPEDLRGPLLPHAGGMPASSRGSERSADPRTVQQIDPTPDEGSHKPPAGTPALPGPAPHARRGLLVWDRRPRRSPCRHAKAFRKPRHAEGVPERVGPLQGPGGWRAVPVVFASLRPPATRCEASGFVCAENNGQTPGETSGFVGGSAAGSPWERRRPRRHEAFTLPILRSGQPGDPYRPDHAPARQPATPADVSAGRPPTHRHARPAPPNRGFPAPVVVCSVGSPHPSCNGAESCGF